MRVSGQSASKNKFYVEIVFKHRADKTDIAKSWRAVAEVYYRLGDKAAARRVLSKIGVDLAIKD